MHPDKIASKDSDPDRTDANLKRARDISQDGRTRAAKLAARLDTLRLYVTALPTELLLKIFESFRTANFPLMQSRNSQAACSLVCRTWSRLAQISLHYDAMVPTSKRLFQFHRTLASSDELGGSVRRFSVSINERYDFKQPIPLSQMIADCLRRTTNLKMLYLDVDPPASLTDEIFEPLRLLPQLNYFQLNQSNYPSRQINTSGFDPMLFRFLPSTVERICLVQPFLDLVRVLPDFLQKIYPCEPAPQAVRPPSDASTQPNGHLKSLEIATNVPHTSNAIDFPSLISTTSLPATLSALTLRLVSRIDNNEQELWNSFIASCKRLEDIDVNLTLVAPSIFHTMPSLEKLQKLKISVLYHPTQAQWEVFGDSIVSYVARTPCLSEFTLRAGLEGYTEYSVDHFIHHLLPKIFTGNRCRLRLFSLGFFNTPRLDTIPEVGPERILHSSQFKAPSISTFELLCMKATLLEHLEIAVPLDFLPRVAAAIERLKHLQNVNLHNYPISIDPAVPLTQTTRYESFLYCCKLLKVHQLGQAVP